MNDGAKESEKKQEKVAVTNEQIYDLVLSLKAEIEEMKIKLGSRDKAVEMPIKTNFNTDPGPWSKKKQ